MSQPTPIRITMPMPLPLKHVHAYLVENGAGWVLIDAGFPSQEALAIMREAIEAKAGSLRNLDAVIVSHFHPDHSGLAGWLQRESDAAVYVHARGSKLQGLVNRYAGLLHMAERVDEPAPWSTPISGETMA